MDSTLQLEELFISWVCMARTDEPTDPAAEIGEVVVKLTKGSPKTQQNTLEQYFLPNASFKHPFCSVQGNRNAILRIFQWYKILSPHIDITINSVGTLPLRYPAVQSKDSMD